MSSTAGATRQLTATAVVTAAVMLLVVAVFLLVRRLSGALNHPLGGAAYVTAALAIGAFASGVRCGLRRPGRAGSPLYVVFSHAAAEPLCFALPGLAAFILLGAVTLPGTAPWAVFLSWFGLVIAEAASWRQFVGRVSQPVRPVGRVSRSVLPKQTGRETRPTMEADEPEVPSGLVQQLSRVRAGGSESIHALVQADVQAGERLAISHVAFCPPLDSPPDLHAHALDVDDAEVRVAQSETFGARIEVRWATAAAAPRSLVVELLGAAKADHASNGDVA